jgi:lysozyme
MRRISTRKRTVTRRKLQNKISFYNIKGIRFLIIGFFILVFIGVLHHYRNGLAYYFSFKSHKLSFEQAEEKRISDVRNYQILKKHEGKAVGLDVSGYQGEIDWELLDKIENKYQIEFVVIRATAGNDKADGQFETNWLAAKKKKIIRGAYHYYRPNENSLEQAELFIKTVKLKKGDLPPILDIEKLPKEQSLANLKLGLRRWLDAIEDHYKVKPIIYTGEKYYDNFLKEEFSDYLFWIANYNFYREKMDDHWLFWQFTEKASIPGIKGNVDVNIFNGDKEQLSFITIE